MIIVGEFLPGELLELIAQHLNAAELDDLAIKQRHDLGGYAVYVHADNTHGSLQRWSRTGSPAGNTTNTDPRSQRIRASRRGGQIMCANSQFICIRRPARTCVLPVPRGPDAPSLTKPDDRTNDGTENNMPDNGFIESFNGRLRDELLNE
ncbi:hypothetical protein, partial [Mesorhizobium sp.]|uniref:hypothetical protein n=1 Tax=Mesorhizobium sp. TaxID=1871066 RepID=UPI0025DD4081